MKSLHRFLTVCLSCCLTLRPPFIGRSVPTKGARQLHTLPRYTAMKHFLSRNCDHMNHLSCPFLKERYLVSREQNPKLRNVEFLQIINSFTITSQNSTDKSPLMPTEIFRGRYTDEGIIMKELQKIFPSGRLRVTVSNCLPHLETKTHFVNSLIEVGSYALFLFECRR